MTLLILFGFTQAGVAQNNPPVMVRILPEAAQVAVNETVDIAVEVRSVIELYGIDILVEFDPTAVEIIDMDPDLPGIQVMLGTFLDPGFVIVNLADNEMGRLRLAMTQLNPSQPKSGNGTLIVMRFKGITLKQDTDITILEAKLASPYGSLIEVDEMWAGVVSVVQSNPGPTNTPIDQQPPGTPMPTATNTPIPSITPTDTPTSIPTSTPTHTQTPLPTNTPTPTQTLPPGVTNTITPTLLTPGTLEPTQTLSPGATYTLSPSEEAFKSPTLPGGSGELTPTTAGANATEGSEEMKTPDNPSSTQEAGQTETPNAEKTKIQSMGVVEGSSNIILPQEEDAPKTSPLWFIIPGIAVAGGVGAFFIFRKKGEKEEKPS